MVEAGAGLGGDAGGRARQDRPCVDGLVRRLVDIPDLLDHAAEECVIGIGAVHQLVIVLELLPRDQAGVEGALPSPEGNGVVERLRELLQHLLRLSRAVRNLWVPVHVEGARHVRHVDQALRVGVQPAPSGTDSVAALRGQLVQERADELVVHEAVWGVLLPEKVENLVHLLLPHLAGPAAEELGDQRLERAVRERARVLRIGLPELRGEPYDASGPLAAEEVLNPQQRVFGGLSGVLVGIGYQIWLAPHTIHKLCRKDLIVEGPSRAIPLKYCLEVLVHNPRSERPERPLKRLEVAEARAAQVVEAECLHDERVLVHSLRCTLLHLCQYHLLDLVQPLVFLACRAELSPCAAHHCTLHTSL
mmetsp:Transcript_42619/g.118674  ORF Transcript_42619/g.118674 Transcript_42619/m.118674 type:complete len:362 (+) Transcript_42619:737-1822(+)